MLLSGLLKAIVMIAFISILIVYLSLQWAYFIMNFVCYGHMP